MGISSGRPDDRSSRRWTKNQSGLQQQLQTLNEGLQRPQAVPDLEARQHSLPGVGNEDRQVLAVFISSQLTGRLRLLQAVAQDIHRSLLDTLDPGANGRQHFAHFKAQTADEAVAGRLFLPGKMLEQLAVVAENP